MQEATFFEELFTDKIQKVREQFLQQGRQEGQRDTSREYILDVLTARFNPPAVQYRRIAKALETIEDLDTLRDLLLALVQADDMTTFEQKLQAAETETQSA